MPITVYLIFVLVLVSFSSGKPGSEKVVPVTSSVQHAEGPHWDRGEQALYYVDTFAPTIFRLQFCNKKTTSQKLDGDSVGLLVPIKDKPKKFVVCRDRKISLFSWDGASDNSGTFEELTSVDEDKPNNQFNDGKADSKGRLWAGTLTRNEDLSVSPNGGSLYLISGDALATPKVMISPVSISNGLAWSKDEKKFFYIDSETRKVISYRFDIVKGSLEAPEILFDLAEHEDLEGIPDGMAIDTDDNLWVALYGGKSVIKINSTSGELSRIVKIPATYVTSATFGGPNLDILYVTTSRLKLTSEEELAKEPLAGCVFAVYNLGVRGFPANNFKL